MAKKTNSKKKILTEDTFNANGNNIVESEGMVLNESAEETDEAKDESNNNVVKEPETIKEVKEEDIIIVDEVKESKNNENTPLDDISETIKEAKENIKEEIKNDSEVKINNAKVVSKTKNKRDGSHDENFYM